MSSLTSGEKSNIGTVTIACSWTFTLLTFLSLCFIAFVRRKTKETLKCDDFVLLAAFGLTVLLVITTTWAIVDEGQGRHRANLSRSQLSLVAKSLLANETLWGLVNTLIRVSVIISLKHIFLQPLCQLLTKILLILSALYGIVLVLEVLLVCRPIAAAWDPNVKGSCGNEVIAYIILETLGLILDLAIAVLPVGFILDLQLNTRQNFAINGVFSVGIIAIIITGLRIKALHIVNSTDFTYSKGYIGLLSILGALLSIMSCSAPSLCPILRGVIELREEIIAA